MTVQERRRCPYQPGREPEGWSEPVTVFDPDPDYRDEFDHRGSGL